LPLWATRIALGGKIIGLKGSMALSGKTPELNYLNLPVICRL
jgi:hypothetical protein